jgi:hypothetical protein
MLWVYLLHLSKKIIVIFQKLLIPLPELATGVIIIPREVKPRFVHILPPPVKLLVPLLYQLVPNQHQHLFPLMLAEVRNRRPPSPLLASWHWRDLTALSLRGDFHLTGIRTERRKRNRTIRSRCRTRQRSANCLRVGQPFPRFGPAVTQILRNCTGPSKVHGWNRGVCGKGWNLTGWQIVTRLPGHGWLIDDYHRALRAWKSPSELVSGAERLTNQLER